MASTYHCIQLFPVDPWDRIPVIGLVPQAFHLRRHLLPLTLKATLKSLLSGMGGPFWSGCRGIKQRSAWKSLTLGLACICGLERLLNWQQDICEGKLGTGPPN